MVIDEEKEKYFWDNWLDRDWGKYLDEIRNAVKRLYDSNQKKYGDLPYYTPHGPDHYSEVENLCHRLIPGDKYLHLGMKERFYLLASAWLHDLGMLPLVVREVYKNDNLSENEIRKNHHITTAKYIVNNWCECGVRDVDKTILSKLCRYHRSQEDLNQCEEKILVGGEEFRLRLLAAYLRLADALDIGPSRVPPEAYAICLSYDIPTDAKQHWIKSKLVNGIDIVDSLHNIVIEFKIPFAEGLGKGLSPLWAQEKINAIITLVCEDIRGELSSVMNIITRDGPTWYLDVKERRAKAELDHQTLNDLRELITNFDIMIHPSASKLLDMILTTIANIAGYYLGKREDPSPIESARKDYDDTKKRIGNFLKTVEERLIGNRPSHLGLHSLIRQCKEIHQNCLPDGDLERFIAEINRIYQDHHISRENVREQAASFFGRRYGRPREKDSFNFLLFGYSELVTKALCGFRDHLLQEGGYNPVKLRNSGVEQDLSKTMRLFICEGQPKTQTSPGDRLLYHDGSQYALFLKRHGFNNVVIIPDIVAGNIIDHIPIDLILLGADGITPRYFIHSAGHGSVVSLVRAHRAMGKKMGRQIVLVTSREKWSPQERAEGVNQAGIGDETVRVENCLFWRGVRDLSAREQIWVPRDGKLLDTLSQEGILFFNPKEDNIPIGNIDYIVTDKAWESVTEENVTEVIHKLFHDQMGGR